jgi:hypothetical protein
MMSMNAAVQMMRCARISTGPAGSRSGKNPGKTDHMK